MIHAKGPGVPTLVLLLFLLLTARIEDTTAAVPRRSLPDEQIISQARLVARGDRTDIYEHGMKVEASFLEIMEAAYGKIEATIGLKLDTATLGSRVRVYVSDSAGVSHVWKGYDHQSDPRAVIFLNPGAYSGAMSGTNATHIHEMTHLFTWRFHSHSLREGIADYVARTLSPGASVGPNPAGGELSLEISPEILALLGTTKPPPGWVSTDPIRRKAYYFASYRLVKYLIMMKGMETFKKLYVSEKPEMAIKDLYGISREEAVQTALRTP